MNRLTTLIILVACILMPYSAKADPCDPIYAGDVTNFSYGEWDKLFLNKELSYKLYKIDSSYRLSRSPYCPHGNSMRAIFIDQSQDSEATFVLRTVAGHAANELLKQSHLEQYLKFKISVDLVDVQKAKLKKLGEDDKSVQQDTIRRYDFYHYVLFGLQGLLPRDDINGRIILGETMRVGLTSGRNYWEASYGPLNNMGGISYKRALIYDDRIYMGWLTFTYGQPVSPQGIKQGVVGINYLLNF